MPERPFAPSDKLKRLIDCDNALLLVMNRFGISLGFGEKTVEAVCSEQEIDRDTFLAVANYICGRDWRIEDISLPSIISYLKKAHSYFLDFMLPTIRRRLIEAINCSGGDNIALLIIKFYDEYVTEVRSHMEYEDTTVFPYVEGLLNGRKRKDYSIDGFARKHNHIDLKLKELKNIIVRYFTQDGNNLLYSALFDIINCENDLNSHCSVEDNVFVPAVRAAEEKAGESPDGQDSKTGSGNGDARQESLSEREKEIITCVAKGMSTKEIADKLFISVHTVTTHRRNISSKLQIHSAAGLTIYAIVNGLLSMEEIRNLNEA